LPLPKFEDLSKFKTMKTLSESQASELIQVGNNQKFSMICLNRGVIFSETDPMDPSINLNKNIPLIPSSVVVELQLLPTIKRIVTV